MVKFRESKTAVNLHTSFAAEAQARTRYNFFANKDVLSEAEEYGVKSASNI